MREIKYSIPADLMVLGLFLVSLAVLTIRYKGPQIIMPDPPEEILFNHNSQVPMIWTSAGSLANVVHTSTLIVIGRCVAIGDVFNGTHLPLDSSKPDPAFFGISQVYDIQVERYVKGCGPEVLHYAQSEGVIIRAKADRSPEAIQAAKLAMGVPPVQAGVRYLFFFRPKGYFEDKYVTGAAQPSRWVLTDGDAWPETPLSNPEAAFPRRPTSTLLHEVEQLVAGIRPTPTLTPTPIPSADLGLAPAQLRVRVGETFTMSLAIRTTEPVRGLQFEIGYDMDVLRLDEISEGTFFGSWAADHGASTMVFGQASRTSGGTAIPLSSTDVVITVLGAGDSAGPAGAGRVFALRFTALAEGRSRLRPMDVRVTRIRFEPGVAVDYVPVYVHDGLVTVVAAGK